MQISKNNNNKYNMYSELSFVNFKARNPEIKKLDDICRKVKNEFPVMSSSKIATFPSFRKFVS